MQKIVVTGGCGFVGNNLLAKLSASSGYSLTILDNESLGKRSWLGDLDIDFISGDIRNKDDVERALAGADLVVHLAADTRVMDSIADPAFNFESNVVGTLNILETMRKLGVKQIVNASTGGAILGDVEPPVDETMVPKPISPYGASKLAVEGYCGCYAATYGLRATSLRFSNVFGPRSFHKGSVVAAFYKNILRGRPLVVYGDGSQTRDYVFVGDIVTAIETVLREKSVGVFQLGTGVPTSINQLIDEMRNVVGASYPIDVDYRDFRDGEIRHTYCDISRARREIGYDPKTTLNAGLAETWQWFIENKELFE